MKGLGTLFTFLVLCQPNQAQHLQTDAFASTGYCTLRYQGDGQPGEVNTIVYSV